MEAGLLDGGDRLECDPTRHRHVPQPATAHRLRDHGALVADDRVVEPGLEHVRPDGAEHPPGDDDHVQAGVARAGERASRALVEHGVLAHQRAVEIARERADLPREAGGKRQPLCGLVRKSTSWVICSADSAFP